MVHPIAQCRLVYGSPTPGGSGATSIPKQGVVAHLLVVSLPDAICHPNFAISVLLTVEEEIRCRWQRQLATGGSEIRTECSRVLEEHLFRGRRIFSASYLSIFHQPFSNRILAETSGLPCIVPENQLLRKMDVVETVGKQGNELSSPSWVEGLCAGSPLIGAAAVGFVSNAAP